MLVSLLCVCVVFMCIDLCIYMYIHSSIDNKKKINGDESNTLESILNTSNRLFYTCNQVGFSGLACWVDKLLLKNSF